MEKSRADQAVDVQRWVQAVWVALALLLIARLVTMAWIPLMDTTEARYGEIGRKMVTLGDWITPWHEMGVPFWGKPVLSFWLTAASFKLLGIHEFAARLPHLMCSLGAMLCVWNVVRRHGPAVATIAAALMGGSLLFFLGGAAVMTDEAMVLGITMATCSTWLAMASDDEAQRHRHRWLAFVGAAIGVMAKGPLTLVLIGTPLFLWALWCGRWRALWQALPWIRGLLLMAALTVPWFWLAERKTPGFIEYFIVGEHFHRFVTPGWSGDLYGNAHHHVKGTIWAYAAGALAPWTLLVPLLWIWQRWKGSPQRPAEVPALSSEPASVPWRLTLREERRLALLWGLVPLVFFTASSNIIWTYVLPAIPGLAWWVAGWMGRAPQQGLRWSLAGVVLSTVLLGVGVVVAKNVGRYDRGSAQGLVRAQPPSRGSCRSRSWSFWEGGPSRPTTTRQDAPCGLTIFRRWLRSGPLRDAVWHCTKRTVQPLSAPGCRCRKTWVFIMSDS